MKNFSIKDLVIIAAIVYFAVMTLLFLSATNRWLANQDTNLKINKEVHIANLLGQYSNDLNSCFEDAKSNKQLNEEICIKTMNESNLAKLIQSWDYGDALATLESEK